MNSTSTKLIKFLSFTAVFAVTTGASNVRIQQSLRAQHPEHPPTFEVATTSQPPQIRKDVRHELDSKESTWGSFLGSMNRPGAVAIGAVSGAIVGALSGLSSGVDEHMFRTSALGGFVGSVLGMVCPIPTNTKKSGAAPSNTAPSNTAPSNTSGNVTELSQPPLEKLRQLALTAVAVSDYEESRAKLKGDTNETLIERKAEKKALGAIEDITAIENISESMNATNSSHMNEGEEAFEDVQDVLSQGDTAEFITAEAAAANDALVTANSLARVEGVGNGTRLRGEDLGPAGDKESFQGDMLPDSKKQLALFQTLAAECDSAGTNNTLSLKPSISAGATWPRGKVKYCFASDVSPRVKHLFLAAANQFKVAIPCLEFVDVGLSSGSSISPEDQQSCNEGPAIFVQSNPAEGCYSYVGWVKWMPSQRLQLQDPGCTSIGTAIHELGHALGMAHEQSRPDRNQHVKIHWSNIQRGMEHNFDLEDKAYTGGQYDVLSIMHYDRFAFAVDPKQPSIEYVGEGEHTELGQRVGLSSYDVAQMVDMYRLESSSCKGSALAGMGCVNKPTDTGADPCNIQQCNGVAAKHCCACGGGVQVQCYKNQACPKSEPLPEMSARECIEDATHLFAGQGYPCIYTNNCQYDVEFTCPNLGCSHKVGSKKYEAAQCNNQYQTKICTAKQECQVYKVE